MRTANHRSEKKKLISSSRSAWIKICFCGVFTKGRLWSFFQWCALDGPKSTHQVNVLRKAAKITRNTLKMIKKWQIDDQIDVVLAAGISFCLVVSLLLPGSSSGFLNFTSSTSLIFLIEKFNEFLCLFSLIFVKLLAYISVLNFKNPNQYFRVRK